MEREGEKTEKDRRVELEDIAKFLGNNTRAFKQRNKYLEVVGLPQNGAVPHIDIKTSTSTSTCEIIDGRGEAETVSNLEVERSPENDATPYTNSARGKKRILTTHEAIESPAKKGKLVF